MKKEHPKGILVFLGLNENMNRVRKNLNVFVCSPFSTSDVAAQNEGCVGWDAVWREVCHYGQNFQGELP